MIRIVDLEKQHT
jgi:WD40 repeat protein